jgi:hypothetical protein
MSSADEASAGKDNVVSSFVAMQLFGPEFTGPATEISHKIGVGTISTIQVYPGNGAPRVGTLPPALTILKNYFAPQVGRVVLYLNPSMISQSLIQQLQSASGVPVTIASPTAASMSSITTNDFLDAQTMATQASAPNQNQQMQRWRILQDTQAKIFEVQQNVTLNKAKTQDKAFKKLDRYIRS